MIEHSLLRRLSFVRHLYNLGVDQSHGPEPLASVALLTLHDASEMFLQIAAEHHDVGKNHIEFIDYWKLLEGKGINLSHREPMRRLNKARVGMKHQGLTLAKSQIDGFRSTVTNFLYDNSLAAFELEFDRFRLLP